jgi:hypothetical protein
MAVRITASAGRHGRPAAWPEAASSLSPAASRSPSRAANDAASSTCHSAARPGSPGLTVESFGRQLGTAAKRELIATALRDHPEASHNAIAKMLSVSPTTVGTVCTEVSNLETSECHHGATGQGARTDRQPKPPSPAEERVEELLRQDPLQSNKQILAAVGLSDNQHRIPERVRERLEDAGEIPLTPERQGADGHVRRVPGSTSPRPASTAQPSPQAPKPADTASAIGAWFSRMGTRFKNYSALWEGEQPPDPSAELEALDALEALIRERRAALRGG